MSFAACIQWISTPDPVQESLQFCALLLLATFFVLGVPGQTEIVGLGNHTLLKDGKVKLNMKKDYTYSSVNIDLNKHKILFPGVCDVQIKNGFIELHYNGELCTVDLLNDLKDEIEFKAGMRDENGIINCVGSSIKESYSNVLPFIYSKNNSDIKSQHRRSFRGYRKKWCKRKPCNGINGTCLEWTSLEVSWSKGGGTVVYAQTHLIGDKGSDTILAEGDNETTFDLDTKEDYKNVFCAPKNKTIVEPEAWTISNTHLKGEYMLVFSLLSLNASNVFDGEQLIRGKPPGQKRKERFIKFVSFYIDKRAITFIFIRDTTYK